MLIELRILQQVNHSSNLKKEKSLYKQTQTWKYTFLSSPFDRTMADNDKIFNVMKTFDLLIDAIPESTLRELCAVAMLETWKEENTTGSNLCLVRCNRKLLIKTYICLTLKY